MGGLMMAKYSVNCFIGGTFYGHYLKTNLWWFLGQSVIFLGYVVVLML
jgi:hypothetical protein